jgi:hypothetical protein
VKVIDPDVVVWDQKVEETGTVIELHAVVWDHPVQGIVKVIDPDVVVKDQKVEGIEIDAEVRAWVDFDVEVAQPVE